MATPFCDVESMVILEYQYRRVTDEHVLELPRSLGIDRGTIGVLGAGGERARHSPAAKGAGQTLGRGTSVIDCHREDGQPECRREVDDPRVAGIFDSDPIAGTHVRLERELDAVERAPDHGQMV